MLRKYCLIIDNFLSINSAKHQDNDVIKLTYASLLKARFVVTIKKISCKKIMIIS
jgi:hypothetical protein